MVGRGRGLRPAAARGGASTSRPRTAARSRGRREACAPATCVEGTGRPAPAMVKVAAGRTARGVVGATARMVREGLLQDARRLRDGVARRRSPRPTASWPASCTPTRTPTTSAEERFKEVSAAYDVVGRRGQAQGVRRGPPARSDGPAASGVRAAPAGPAASGPARASTSTSAPPTSTTCSAACSAAAAARRPGATAAAAQRRGADLEAELHLSFLDAVHGRRDVGQPRVRGGLLHLSRQRGQAGTTRGTCPRCDGRGVLDDNQGFFSFSSPCPECAGPRHAHRRAVPDLPRRRRRAPAAPGQGADPGRRRRRPAHPPQGSGGPGATAARRATSTSSPTWRADPVFGRDGRNLTLTVPVTFPEAALGTKLKVPTLDGDPVTLKLPAGTNSGQLVPRQGSRRPARRRAAATCSSPSRWPYRPS